MRAIPVLAALALSACAGAALDEPPSIFTIDAGILSCSPATLQQGQSLVLALGPGHGRELAIVREADETPYFLVVQSPPEDMRVLMSREAFAQAVRVEVPSSATGYKWVGDGGNERIFTTPGAYEILISDNLEADGGGHMCSVDYRG